MDYEELSQLKPLTQLTYLGLTGDLTETVEADRDAALWAGLWDVAQLIRRNHTAHGSSPSRYV
jgi:hypothetical protein